jgi:serine/threonine protein kinase
VGSQQHPDKAVLSRFADGSLPQKARSAIYAHLESCEACRAAVRTQPESRPRLSGDPLIGELLGEYRVLERIGRGGMGVVYRGEQPQIGKQVAIKVVLRETPDDPEALQRLMEEARAVNAVRHPNIVDIFNIGQLPDGRPYMVMELLEGTSLAQLVFERERLTVPQTLHVLAQALAGLAAAHAAGVVHRDLKPENIFVDARAEPWKVTLLDFGLALRLASEETRLTQPGLAMGTPAFMAPEQFRGESGPDSDRLDVYAMGMVAWTMLAGRTPFGSGSAPEVMYRALMVPAPPLPPEVEGVPPSLEVLVLRMLEKDPARRPPAAKVLEVVQALQRGQTPSIPPLPGTGLGRLGWVVLGGLAAVGFLATGVWALQSREQPTGPAAPTSLTEVAVKPPPVIEKPLPPPEKPPPIVAQPQPPRPVGLPPLPGSGHRYRCSQILEVSVMGGPAVGPHSAFFVRSLDEPVLLISALPKQKALLKRVRTALLSCKGSDKYVIASATSPFTNWLMADGVFVPSGLRADVAEVAIVKP